MLKKIKIVCLITIFLFHQSIFGSFNKLNMQEFQHAVHLIFMCKSWKDIKQKYKEYNVGINAPVGLGGKTALMKALAQGRLKMAAEILEEEDVSVRYQDSHGDTALHIISGERPYIQDIPLYLSIVKTLISKVCPINKLNDVEKPCLAYVYDYSDSNFSSSLASSIDNGEYSKLNDDGDEWSIFNVALSSLLIKNGALLMIDQDDEKWSILSDLAKHVKDDYYRKSKRKSSLRIDKNILQDAFYKTFKRDYEQYKITYLTTVLILKRVLKDKKIIMLKGPIQYITSLVCSDPTAHIEKTLEDACNRLGLSNYFEKPLSIPENVRSIWNDIKPLIIPGAWKRDWDNYCHGDKRDYKLVTKAIEYVGREEHRW